MEPVLLSGDQFILVSLLIQIGFMASFASLLVTTRFFKRLLVQDRNRPADPYWFALAFGLALAVGVSARMLLGYAVADLSHPGALLAGLFAGPVAGMVVGVIAGGAAALRGEWLALPFVVGCGLLGGGLSRLPGARNWKWEYSAYPYMNVYRMLRARTPLSFAPVIVSIVCLGLDIVRSLATRELGPRVLWSYEPDHLVVLGAVWLTNLVTLGIPFKIWNNTRLEQLLKEQEGLAVRARLDALTQQINPHFLFNTLNSIRSATRVDPDMARDLIQKLSDILRRVLETRKTFVPLEEELAYIDAYLDIEVARFGADKLRIIKDVDVEARGALVPCMILQPLVENAVLHAIAPLPEGGTVTIRARCGGEKVRIAIEDDGVGFDPSKLELERPPRERRLGRGIGLANVHQRLDMAYGRGLAIQARRGVGTSVTFEVPFAPSRELLGLQEPGLVVTGAGSAGGASR
jgi:two-component system, LytTR family, sensor kinase